MENPIGPPSMRKLLFSPAPPAGLAGIEQINRTALNNSSWPWIPAFLWPIYIFCLVWIQYNQSSLTVSHKCDLTDNWPLHCWMHYSAEKVIESLDFRQTWKCQFWRFRQNTREQSYSLIWAWYHLESILVQLMTPLWSQWYHSESKWYHFESP